VVVNNTITQRHVRSRVNLEQDRLLHLNVRLYLENFVHILPHSAYSPSASSTTVSCAVAASCACAVCAEKNIASVSSTQAGLRGKKYRICFFNSSRFGLAATGPFRENELFLGKVHVLRVLGVILITVGVRFTTPRSVDQIV
jgi:hypothetical protein